MDERSPLPPILRRASSLPPLGAAAAVLAAGIVLPFLVRAGDRPTELTASLARSRLERLAAERPGSLPAVAPSGEIHTLAPAFFWPVPEGAKKARVRLSVVRANGREDLWLGTDMADAPPYLLPPPGTLKSMRTYRLSVQPVDESGEPVTEQGLPLEYSSEFQVRSTDAEDDLDSRLARARKRLSGAEADFVVAGIYASALLTGRKGVSVADVASALASCIRAAPDGEHAQLARTVLNRLRRS